MSTSLPARPPRIIIADDHEWIRQILGQVTRETLPLAEVIETVDGLKALEAFQNGAVDFLISNHFMPKMNGMELVRTVRERLPELPILMVSTDPGAVNDAMDSGANWFLAKEQIMEHMPPLLRGHTRGGVGPAAE